MENCVCKNLLTDTAEIDPTNIKNMQLGYATDAANACCEAIFTPPRELHQSLAVSKNVSNNNCCYQRVPCLSFIWWAISDKFEL